MQEKRKKFKVYHPSVSFCTLGLICTAFMLTVWGLGGFSLHISPPCHTAAIAIGNNFAVDEKEASDPSSTKRPKIILDAGHGGEDGGALSSTGVAEKTLNLSLTMRLGAMLEAAGMEVVYTRVGDDGLYEGAVKGHRKMTDLKNRLAVAKANPDALFLSLHMNSFQIEKYHGTQIFYTNNEESKALAMTIQAQIKEHLQPENTRVPKAADSSIFLLSQNEGTAVLIECGFLSNTEEATRLGDGIYQEKLAAVICTSVLDFIAQEG